MNVEDLLNQLSAEELEQLSEDVDPDDSLLPPSQRCKDQTSKLPTGPLNRRQMLNFLTKFAKEQEDWPELKKFVPGVKLGKRPNVRGKNTGGTPVIWVTHRRV